jgi:hypothetical protein
MHTFIIILTIIGAVALLFALVAAYLIFFTEDTYIDIHIKHIMKQQNLRNPTKIIPFSGHKEYPLAS